MYVYQDQYGWTVAAFTDASKSVKNAAHNGPRSFRSRAEAQRWIEEQVA